MQEWQTLVVIVAVGVLAIVVVTVAVVAVRRIAFVVLCRRGVKSLKLNSRHVFTALVVAFVACSIGLCGMPREDSKASKTEIRTWVSQTLLLRVHY